MPDDVIERIHRMARQQNADPGLIFGDRNMNTIDEEVSDDDDDEDYLPERVSDEESQIDDDEGSSTGDTYSDEGPAVEDDDGIMDAGGEEVEDDNSPDEYAVTHEMGNAQDLEAGRSANPGVSDTEITGVDGVDDTETRGVVQVEHEMLHQAEDSGSEPKLDIDSGTSLENDEKVGATSDESNLESSEEPRYNLRDKRTRCYNHMYDPGMYQIEDSDENKEEEVVMVTTNDVPEDTPQMSMKQGLRMFGEDGYAAVRKEMQQLHDRKVMQPINRKDLTLAKKREALGYLMFLKKKRNGTVKGRGCADGRKQRAYISKEESTSPTISTEAVFLTAVVDAWENRKVAVLDVPGAFMQVDMDELVHVRFEGEMVDKLLEIDEELYASYVTEEKGKKVMYVELLKALYGTL